MAHPNRSRQRANQRRRDEADRKQFPLPLEVQAARCAANQKAHAARYPHPPTYTDAWGRKPRSQPACYDLGLGGSPFAEFLTGLALLAMRRGARLTSTGRGVVRPAA